MRCKLRSSYSRRRDCSATFRERCMRTIARRNCMNRTYCLGVAATVALIASGVANADVDISVAIRGEVAPGVYGRVDLGGRPPPTLVYAKPVLIERPPAHV